MRSFETLWQRITGLERQLDKLDQRISGTLIEGVIKSVNHEKALAVVEAEGIETKEVPWLTRAGSVSEWNPPTEGERVLLASPGGDLGRAMILPGGYSSSNPSPHDQGGEFVRVTGQVRVTQSAQSIKIEAGGVAVEISGSGLTVTGGRVEHDGKNIGSDHIHGGVMAGGDLTDVPQN